jgi:hypothetical protein
VESGYDRTIDFLKKRGFPRKAGAFDRNIDVLGKVAQCGGGPSDRPSFRMQTFSFLCLSGLWQIFWQGGENVMHFGDL